jgi:hypothetical protein
LLTDYSNAYCCIIILLHIADADAQGIAITSTVASAGATSEHSTVGKRMAVLSLDLTALLQWRGMMQSGPGSAKTSINVALTSLRFALNSSGKQSSSQHQQQQQQQLAPSLITPITATAVTSTLVSGVETSTTSNAAARGAADVLLVQDKTLYIQIREGVGNSYSNTSGAAAAATAKPTVAQQHVKLSTEAAAVSLYTPLDTVAVTDVTTLGRCELQVSVPDVRLLTAIIRSVASDAVATIVMQHRARQQRPLLSPPLVPHAPQQLPARSFDIQVQSAELQLVLVSNALGLPLFAGDVTALQSVYHSEVVAIAVAEGTVQASIAARYFNQNLYRWEHVIEQFPIAAVMRRDGVRQATTATADAHSSTADSRGSVSGDNDVIATSGMLQVQVSYVMYCLYQSQLHPMLQHYHCACMPGLA